MSRTLYIFGAGASAEGLPVVSEMRDFLAIFYAWIKSNERLREPSSNLGLFIKELETVILELKDFPSPDTYARKLFLTNDPRYNRVKNIFSLFFIWCEFCDDYSNLWGHITDFLNPNKAPIFFGIPLAQESVKSLLSKISVQLDKRYISFLSALLTGPDNKIIPDSISFFTWNYDSQINKALKLLGTSIQFYTFHCGDKYNSGTQLYRLNGSATINSEDYLVNGKWDTRSFLKILSDYLSLKSNIQYAWDSGMEESDKTTMCVSLMSVEKVVVIGYSFPVYNRKKDKQIFSSLIDGAISLHRLDGYPNNPIEVLLVGVNEMNLLTQKEYLDRLIESIIAEKNPTIKPRFEVNISQNNREFYIPMDIEIFGEK